MMAYNTYNPANEQNSVVKPYALMDLDDTLFQTERKLKAWGMNYAPDDLTVASINKAGEPLSMMTPRQVNFFHWLSASTELIPVTARDTTEITRVQLPFTSWRILTHGAVIVHPDGNPLDAWQQQMATVLAPLQNILADLIDTLDARHDASQLAITPHFETYFNQSLCVYVAIKHRERDHDVLANVAQSLAKELLPLDNDFYIHHNANNVAVLPNAIHKCNAVKYLLDNQFEPDRPCFGFGDSFADLPFLQLLDWYGTPSNGQLHQLISKV